MTAFTAGNAGFSGVAAGVEVGVPLGVAAGADVPL
jgi:hypothetical protein